MRFAERYKLLKDTPTHKAGSVLIWEGMAQLFYFTVPGEKYDPDRNGPHFTVEQIQDAEWFMPMKPLKPFIPKFPSRKNLEEFATLDANCRLVDSVDECRAINGLINDPKFQRRLYDFYKQEYEKFYKL